MPDMDFGLWMTVMGMGSVFTLLALLWLLLWVIGKLDQRPTKAAPVKNTKVVIAETGEFTGDEIAAIAVAVLAEEEANKKRTDGPARAHEPGSHLFASRWVAVGRSFQHQPWTRG